MLSTIIACIQSGQLAHGCVWRAKKALVFRIMLASWRTRGWLSSSWPPTRSLLNSQGSTYTPICHARRVWHKIAHVKQIIMGLIRPRQSGSTIPHIFLPLTYLLHISSGIWGAPNRKVNFWVKFDTCYWLENGRPTSTPQPPIRLRTTKIYPFPAGSLH